jgi:zinc transport system substrate-binding protein
MRHLDYCIIAWLVVLSCHVPQRAVSGEHLTVYVVNYPLQYFAERIAGEHATVVFPAPAEVDPAFWMPDPPTIAAYHRADLILLNGATYATWLSKVTLPYARSVDTSVGFQDRYLRITDAITHTHGPTGAHTHAGYAFTTWLDFALATQQAQAIAEALSRKQPALRDTFQRRYATLAQDLLRLDQELQVIVSKHPQQPLVASHPVYDYLVRRYGLNLKSLHWEPDVIPSEAEWATLRALRQDHPARWMIWEAEPIPGVVASLRAMDIHSIVFAPCANVPGQGDFLSVMRQNVENLSVAFQ